MVYLEMRHGHSGVDDVAFSRPYALCLPCLALWFPGWDHDRVEA